MGEFITHSADEVKAMNNLPGVPPTVEFVGSSIDVSEDTTLYVAVAGDDVLGDGSEGNPWATLQRAFDAVPEGYNADLVIQLGAGTFERAVLKATITEDAAIAVVGDRSNPTPIAGAVWGFLDNATATATVAATGDFGRGERWMEPGTLPAPPQIGSKEFAGTAVESLSGTTLRAAMGDTAAGDQAVALHPYSTFIAGGASELGTHQYGVNLTFVGCDLGDDACSYRNFISVGSKVRGNNFFSSFEGCGGFFTMMDDGGSVTPFFTSPTFNQWRTLCGIYECSLFFRGPNASVSTAVLNPGAAQACVNTQQGGANPEVNFCEVESGVGFVVSSGRMDILGNVNFDPACTRAFAAINGGTMLVTGAFTGSITGTGAEADTGGRIDGAVAAAVTASGTDLTAGTVTGTYGGGAIVDPGVALAAIT